MRTSGEETRPTPTARLIAFLRQISPLANRVALLLRALALMAGAAAGATWLVVREATQPHSTEGLVLLLVGLLALAAPPLLLLLSYLALRELIELPARLRELPGLGAEHAAEFGRVADGLRQPAIGGFIAGVFRLARLLPSVVSVSELLTLAPLLRVVSPPFVVLTIGAVLLSVLEIALAIPVIALLVLLRVLAG